MSEHQSRWTPAATRGDGSPEELANATCALCGIELSIISLVPDGGPGCAQVRWYCRDIVSCTERWTADRARSAVQAPVPGGNAPDPGAEPVPDEQAAHSRDTASVPGDAPASAEKPDATEEPDAAEKPDAAEEPKSADEPRRGKIRAGQSSEGG